MEKNATELRVCPVCGASYLAETNRLKYGRQTTCSRACSYQLRVSSRRTSQEMVCAFCGKPVRKTPARLARSRHAVFCSRACHYAGRTAGISKRVVLQPYTYTEEGKAALVAASRKPKGKRIYHLLECLNCGETFDDPNGGRKRVSGMTFCSLQCCNAYRTGERNPAWRGGYPGYYGPDWRGLRRAARRRDDYTCRRCGVVQKPPMRAPDVHHIKPVSMFAEPNEANYLENVVCLCHRCHMLVEWHGMDFTP